MLFRSAHAQALERLRGGGTSARRQHLRMEVLRRALGAGGVAQSFLSRMPALLAHVGPIKGASLHVSRRIANNLRAGTGVKDYSALAKCGIIFIAVPEDVLDKIAGELAAAVPLGGKPVVICDVLRNSQVPGPLHDSGARIATLNCIPGLEEKLFVAEGHAGVVTELERLLAHDQRKLIYAKPDAKSLYLSGIYIAEHLFLPWIAGAVDSLRAAGFTRAEATKVVRSLGWRALRAQQCCPYSNRRQPGAAAQPRAGSRRATTAWLARSLESAVVLAS